MAEVNAKDLTTKTSPASTDSMLLFGTTSNEGAKITVDNLADNILSRLSTKTFANQVGGSSAATLLSQLSTLNSKTVSYLAKGNMTGGTYNFTIPSGTVFKVFYTANGNGAGVAEYTGIVYSSASISNLAEIKSNRYVTVELTGGNLTITTSSTGTLVVVTF